jgi:RecB family endonuclease NucS
VQQLEAVEPGLHLVERQLSTPAGRLDLLCKDANGSYVVVELKRMQGSDQVMGQILRYMGWLKQTHPTDKVRGIVIVGNKDQALSYAASAVPDVQVKEFKLLIQ